MPPLPDGYAARETPGGGAGTPPRGVPHLRVDTPGGGATRLPDGTPEYGTPRVRGGHPEQRETGGGWGNLGRGTDSGTVAAGGSAGTGPTAEAGTRAEADPADAAAGAGTGRWQGAFLGDRRRAARGKSAGRPEPRIPRQREEPGVRSASYPDTDTRPAYLNMPPAGPRQAYLDAFEEVDDVFAPGQRHRVATAAAPATATGSGGDGAHRTRRTGAPDGIGRAGGGNGDVPAGAPGAEKGRGGRGRAFTGIAAAAVTTALAVVVAGQVAGGDDGATVPSQAAGGGERDSQDEFASRSDGRPTPSGASSPAPLSYEQKMDKTYALAADLDGSGEFQAVTGFDKAPGAGQKYRYRVDVEEGLGLDGELFAEAVQKTLNDDRSWAHNGGRTFERISSGKPDFVITLASPGTTADWCAKSGLDTTIDNVSCDSAATDRVMINAYRWAQGAETYGDQMYAYRQMLINHEIGHRLGYNHVTCDKDGDLAPVMQQQTKFLEYRGIHCEANPWPFPKT
ncbi:hypothetical protein GCM10010145_07720 [Streptomyces ruber]|uniref:DUF3152 domain-containing protein n=2 Tax=Streptomyces TaxID=1883 RepID=A0A918EPG1_9ACTN|nr:hypothetical protein GCM10010145_07720 [Streptomyces ruber]